MFIADVLPRVNWILREKKLQGFSIESTAKAKFKELL